MNIHNIQDIPALLKVAGSVVERRDSKESVYRWVEDTLVGVKYLSLGKRERGMILDYLAEYSGLSKRQVQRLVKQYVETGYVRRKKRTQPTFEEKYTVGDIALLAQVSEQYGHMNGRAVCRVLRGMYEIHRDERFVRLKDLSPAHLYRLRRREVFRTSARHFTKTRKSGVPIGVRKKPYPSGEPGYIRVDTVHQGDRDREKGVYHINLVDEITQWQVVVCVEGISERFLLPALEEALHSFPFRIQNFHSDNGSEYVNHRVADLLQTLHISQTKGRSRHCNDNALVEGKNASTIRKYLGHGHIPKRHAEVINQFYREYFNTFLNYHRYCAFPEEEILPTGKIIKHYREYRTPTQKILSLPSPEQYLRGGVTLRSLQREALRTDHFTAAQQMQQAKYTLFSSF